ncbi:MAG: hypothetical protein AB1480_15650 [Nitrospirota bacterium]
MVGTGESIVEADGESALAYRMPLADIFSGLMISLGFALLYKGIPGAGLMKGLTFGLIIWLITRFAGELFWYVMSPVPFMLVVAGWLHGLIVSALGGIVLAAFYGKTLEHKHGEK